MLSISKSNTTILNASSKQNVVTEEHHQSQMAELGRLRELMGGMLEELRDGFVDREDEGRRGRDRDSRRDRQESLEREEKIIKFIQE